MDGLEKIKEILLPEKDFCSQPKHGRYYWCRLHAHKRSL